MWTRRSLMQVTVGALGAATVAPLLPAYAVGRQDPRMVVIVLRGALDGLAAVPAYGDRAYLTARGDVATPPPGAERGALDLDGMFGLHPAMASLMPLWNADQFAVVHATGTPYRDRSHFDGQDVLENGTHSPFQTDTGWLNRALVGQKNTMPAVAIGRDIPKILRGQAAVTSTDPSRTPRQRDAFLDTLQSVYASDPMLHAALTASLEAQDMLASHAQQVGLRGGGRVSSEHVAQLVGSMLSSPIGPRVAVLEMSGWDTHVGQQATLNRQLASLSEAIAAFPEAMGDAWRQTAVVVISEFGRTVRGNGTGGTDHGTGGVALLAGGALRGGRVIHKWPGLSNHHLLDGRDLAPSIDLRAVLKGTLRDHLGIPDSHVEDAVFPNSREIRALDGLWRA